MDILKKPTNWIYQNRNFKTIREKYKGDEGGFTYEVHQFYPKTNKWKIVYYGEKGFKTQRSNWPTYKSSNKKLKELIKELGLENFKFIITGLYETEIERKAAETIAIYENNAYEDGGFFNGDRGSCYSDYKEGMTLKHLVEKVRKRITDKETIETSNEPKYQRWDKEGAGTKAADDAKKALLKRIRIETIGLYKGKITKEIKRLEKACNARILELQNEAISEFRNSKTIRKIEGEEFKFNWNANNNST